MGVLIPVGESIDDPVRVEVRYEPRNMTAVVETATPLIPLAGATIYDELGNPLAQGTVVEVDGRRAEIEGALTLLSRVPAYPVMAAGSRTLDDALRYVLAVYQERYPWLRVFVPNMYLIKPGGALGRPTVEAIHVQIDEDDPPSVLEVIQRFLAAVPGYEIYERPNGTLAITPPRNTPILVIRQTGVTAYPLPFIAISNIYEVWDPPRLYSNGLAIAIYRDGDLVGRWSTPAFTLDRGETYSYDAGGAQFTLTWEENGDLHVEVFSGYSWNEYSLYGLIYPAPTRIPGTLAVSRVRDARRLPNEVLVINRGRLEYVRTTNVLQPSMLRVWGAYSTVNYPEMQRPTLADLGSPARYDLGLFRPRYITNSPELPPQTVYVPVQSPVIIGGYVDVTLVFKWWADQSLDFPGPGPAGEYTTTIRVYVGETKSVRSWPSLPGPDDPLARDGYAQVAVSLDVRGGILYGVWLTIEGYFSHARISLGFPGIGLGDWALGLGLFIDGDALVWSESNTEVRALFRPEDDPNIVAHRAALGPIRQEIEISTISIDSATATSIARGAIEVAWRYTDLPVEVSIAPPWCPMAVAGYPVEAGGWRGRAYTISYEEEHSPLARRTTQTIQLTEAVYIGEELPPIFIYQPITTANGEEIVDANSVVLWAAIAV